MAGPTTEVLSEDLKTLTHSVTDLRIDVAGVKRELYLIRWIGGFASGVLLLLVGGAFGVTWNASALNSEVKQQGVMLQQVEGRLGTVEQKVGTVEQKLGSVEQKLGSVEQKLGLMEQKLGSVEQKMDTLLQRTAPKP